VTDQPVRFGLVGLGRAAVATLPSILRHPHTALFAAADTRTDLVERFAQQYSVRGYSSVEALCADPDIDAVYIATPTHLHTEHVLTAARAAKHVIVEKPLAITLADADRMIEAVEHAGIQMIVGQSQSYEPPIKAIREIVRSGRLGRLGMINGWYFNDWLYRPRLPAELDTSQGGGVIFRQGAHHFDVARLIGGGLVRSVRASVGVWDPNRPTEGAYTAFLEFEDGAAASLSYSGYDHFHSAELTGQTEGGTRAAALDHAAARKALATAGDAALKGQGGFGGPARRDAVPEFAAYFGLLIVSCEHGDIRQTPRGLLIYGDDRRDEIALDLSSNGRDLMIAELYDAVCAGKPPLHTARWATGTLEVSLAILESARTRREVTLHHQVATID
jgi:phthalate 4,5-cis-dihydrodiol dehydrogenase